MLVTYYSFQIDSIANCLAFNLKKKCRYFVCTLQDILILYSLLSIKKKSFDTCIAIRYICLEALNVNSKDRIKVSARCVSSLFSCSSNFPL